MQSVAAGPVAAGVGVALLLAATPLLVRHVRHRPDGFLPRAVVTSRVATGTSLAAAAVPAAWFGLLLAVPTALAERGWTPLQTGLVLVPAAVTGLLAPRISGPVLARLGGLRTLALAAAGASAAVLLAALGAALGQPAAMAAGVAGVTIAFGLGQPALVAAVGGAVPAQVRGIALGTATLVFLVGGGVGSAVVGGLTAVTSTAAALVVVAALAAAASLGAGYLARTAS